MSGNFWRYAVALLVIGLMLAAFVLPAFAATPPAAPDPASEYERPITSDVAPDCVTARLDEPGIVTETIHILNGCDFSTRAKILVRAAPDSECLTFERNEEQSYAMHHFVFFRSAFDGLHAC